MHILMYCGALSGLLLALFIGQAFCVPIQYQAYDNQVLKPTEGRHDDNQPVEYYLPMKRLNIHGVLKRDTLTNMGMNVAPKTPAITTASSSVGDTGEKPKFLRTVAQGLSNFFKAIKNWFQSDSKSETFKALGRRFSSWFRNIKEKILQSKTSPAPDNNPLPGKISSESAVANKLKILKGDADAEAEQAAKARGAGDPAPSVTGSEPVKKPGKARVPAAPGTPVKEPSQALVAKPFEPVKQPIPVKPVAPIPENIDKSGAEIDGAFSRGPESIALDATPERISPSKDTPKLVLPKLSAFVGKASPTVAAPQALKPEIPTPKAPAPERAEKASPNPEVASAKTPLFALPKLSTLLGMSTPEIAAPHESNPEAASPKAHTLEIASPKAPTPKAASTMTIPSARTPKMPVSQAVTSRPPTPDVPAPQAVALGQPTPNVSDPQAVTPKAPTTDVPTPEETSVHLTVRPLGQIKPPYRNMKELNLLTEDVIRNARERDAAEKLAQRLDSEYEGSFEDDQAQDALRPAMGDLVDNDYERLQSLPSGYRSPFSSEYESGPPRGRIGTFSKEAEQELADLKAEGYTLYPSPNYDEGIRNKPTELDPMDNLFLEQGLDPLKVSVKDRRNYAIILEWYKQSRAPQDRKHPQHQELYDATRNPPPDEHGRRYLWGTQIYHDQTSYPAPVPYMREKMKEAGTLEKIGKLGTFGLVSNDPNRPHFWFHDWIPGFDRRTEIEDWIQRNVDPVWIDKNFPTEIGPVSKKHYTNLSPLEREARITAYNNRYKDAASRKNKENAARIHEVGLSDASYQAFKVGGNQATAALDFPTEEEILRNRSLWERLKKKLFAKQARYNLLAKSKNMHAIDRADLHMRMEADGVLVVDP